MADNEGTKDGMAERVKATMSGQPPKVENTSATREQQLPDNQAPSTRSGAGSGLTNPPTQPDTSGGSVPVRGVPSGTGEHSGATNPTVPQGRSSAEANATVGEIKQQDAEGRVIALEDPTKTEKSPALAPLLGAPALRSGDLNKRIQAIDKVLKAQEDETARVRTTDIALLRAQKAELERHEAQRISGAPVLLPRARMLDASFAQDQRPEFNYRWINLHDAGRVGARKADGWEKVPEEEGGTQLGDELALFRIPKEQHNRLRTGIRRRNEAQFTEPVKQFDKELEGVVRFMRDKMGVKLSDSEIRRRLDNSDREE